MRTLLDSYYELTQAATHEDMYHSADRLVEVYDDLVERILGLQREFLEGNLSINEFKRRSSKLVYESLVDHDYYLDHPDMAEKDGYQEIE